MTDLERINQLLGTSMTEEEWLRVKQVAEASSRRAAVEVEAPDERCYFYIEWRGFSTIVPSTDCESISNAFYYARHEKLQAWYLLDETEIKEGTKYEDIRIEAYTHSQYCDWLRRKEVA